MSPPPRALKIALKGDRLDALFSALRRGSTADALAILATPWVDMLADESDPDWEDYVESELSAWVRAECRLHVEAGRFQHAIAVLDRYCILPQLLTQADAEARAIRMERR